MLALRPLPWPAPLALASLALPSAGRGDVLVVDAAGGPGSQFAEIQDAVDAAADGDLVLVRSGTYASVAIDGLSVSVVADEGADVAVETLVARHLEVRGLASGEAVVVRGIDLVATNVLLQPVLIVQDNDGAVLIEDVRLDTFVAGFVEAVRVDASADVVFTRLALSAPQEGMAVAGSTVSLFGSTIHGGTGWRAVALEASTLYASGCTFEGGDGYDTLLDCTGGPGGDGGNALVIDALSTATLLGSTLVAGGPGCNQCTGECGEAGTEVSGTGTVTTLAPSARSLEATTPVRDGGTLVATHAGEPGDLVLALYAPGFAPTPFLPSIAGPLIPQTAHLGFAALGTVPATGTLTTTFPAHFPGPGFVEVFVQDLFVDTVGAVVASNANSVVYLGPGL